MHSSHVTVHESFPVFSMPAFFADIPPGLGMHRLDVPVQTALPIGGVVALFAKVVLDLLVHCFHMFLHVAGRV